jgi:hypothetical protein
MHQTESGRDAYMRHGRGPQGLAIPCCAQCNRLCKAVAPGARKGRQSVELIPKLFFGGR